MADSNDQATQDTIADEPTDKVKRKNVTDVDDAFGAHALADHSDSGSGE